MPMVEDEEDDDAHVLMKITLDDVSLFPDLSSSAFLLYANPGERVVVRRGEYECFGEIIETERLSGGYRYFIIMERFKRGFEGMPVFVGENLIGVLTKSDDLGFALVTGLESILRHRDVIAMNRRRALDTQTTRTALESLYDEENPNPWSPFCRPTFHETARNRLTKLQLFLDDEDWEVA